MANPREVVPAFGVPYCRSMLALSAKARFDPEVSNHVFLIEPKSHVGKITFDGQQLRLDGKPFRKNPVCQIQRNIRWLGGVMKKIIPVRPWIVAVLVFTNATMYSAKGKPVLRLRPVNRINVINSRYLNTLIESYSPRHPRPAIWRNLGELL